MISRRSRDYSIKRIGLSWLSALVLFSMFFSCSASKQISGKDIVIEKHYNLQGKTLYLPTNGSLTIKEGGRLSNGVIVFSNTTVTAAQGVFDNSLKLSGSIANDFDFGWWNLNLKSSVTPFMQQSLDIASNSGKTLVLPEGEFLLSQASNSEKRSSGGYCLEISRGFSLVGAGAGKTILKTVRDNLTTVEGKNTLSKIGSSSFAPDYKTLIKVSSCKKNFSIRIEGVTLDGTHISPMSRNINHGHKALYVKSSYPYYMTSFYAKDVVVKNFEGEAFYNESYDCSSPVEYVVKECRFINNGGSSGNLGGIVLYDSCYFERAGIEHCWGKSKCPKTLHVKNCVFKNYRVGLSCDVQGTLTSEDEIGNTRLFVEGCKFYNDALYLAECDGKTDHIIAILANETDSVEIRGNEFDNASYKVSYGGYPVYIDKYVHHIRISDNVITSSLPGVTTKMYLP